MISPKFKSPRAVCRSSQAYKTGMAGIGFHEKLEKVDVHGHGCTHRFRTANKIDLTSVEFNLSNFLRKVGHLVSREELTQMVLCACLIPTIEALMSISANCERNSAMRQRNGTHKNCTKCGLLSCLSCRIRISFHN